MLTSSLIDDVRMQDDDDKGHPILFTNQEIRRMLDLVHAGPRDVFYDLGSGWGQNMIIALTEFQVKKAVGIEKDRERHHFSLERLAKWQLAADRASVLQEDFEKALSGRVKGVDVSEATILFYGLSTYGHMVRQLSKRLKQGAKLVYYYPCLFPEIMPDRVGYPFFVSTAPFRHPKSKYEWLSSVVQKDKSSIRKGRSPSIDELWNELYHDYDVKGVPERIDDYQRRLARIV